VGLGDYTVINEFLRDKSLPRLIMIGALLLNFVSQFFNYYDDGTTGYLTFGPNFGDSTGYYNFGLYGIGWAFHPQAYVIIVVLAFALLRDDIALHPLFMKFGYWVSFLLIGWAASPGAPMRAEGAAAGWVAVLIALGAALLHQFSKKAAPAKAPPQ
jgi:hypothetical protein